MSVSFLMIVYHQKYKNVGLYAGKLKNKRFLQVLQNQPEQP